MKQYEYRMGWAGAAKLVAEDMPVHKPLNFQLQLRTDAEHKKLEAFEKGDHQPEWSAQERHEYFADLINHVEPAKGATLIGFDLASGSDQTVFTVRERKHSQLPAGLSAADGWVAWGGGECPIPDAKAGEYEIRSIHGPKGCCDEWTAKCAMDSNASVWEMSWLHLPRAWPIIAYRLLQDPNKWHDGPPPSVGWWSVKIGSSSRGPMAHWDGELWSIHVYAWETESEISDALKDRHESSLQWRHGRPEWAKDIERLAGGV